MNCGAHAIDRGFTVMRAPERGKRRGESTCSACGSACLSFRSSSASSASPTPCFIDTTLAEARSLPRVLVAMRRLSHHALATQGTRDMFARVSASVEAKETADKRYARAVIEMMRTENHIGING